MSEMICPCCGQYIDVSEIRADAIDECKNLCRRMGNNTFFTDDWLRDFIQKLELLKEQK